MPNADVNFVRSSRDGDQFHYLWAARQCLELLDPRSDLTEISIEGASPEETSNGKNITAGEQVIDVAQYYGDDNNQPASRIKYIQLKHSTRNQDSPWPLSGLKKTLEDFAARFQALIKEHGTAAVEKKYKFHFVTNRPINRKIIKVISELSQNISPRNSAILEKLKEYTSLEDESLASFFATLRLQEKERNFLEQRGQLSKDLQCYLPGPDADAAIRLKDLIARKATTEFQNNNRITKYDVLRVLDTDEEALFPAPRKINVPQSTVPREQESELTKAIIQAKGQPVIICADGGVGKSVLAMRLENHLPSGSVSVIYDCFGNGEYRRASTYRHRHQDALVQIANELASAKLCDPLIPSQTADPSSYFRAFLSRLRQAVQSIRATCSDALLCVVIDAADNAEMGAKEAGNSHSFAHTLLREEMPPEVRLVMLSRKHRVDSLNPPHNTLWLELKPFSEAETAQHLRSKFPQATSHDVKEFHGLTSQNPRVQAMAFQEGDNLSNILQALGPGPISVEDTISRLLESAVGKLRDEAGMVDEDQIDRICIGLAALPPLVPVKVLAKLADVSKGAVRSFAADLGRPLLIQDDLLQFRDEPTETWFQDQFKPESTDLLKFVQNLRPFAQNSSYVASVLPQLLLESKKFDELMDLALSSSDLPEGSPLEKRNIELQRLKFALKASLRAKRYADAAKLALKAGGETAGGERRQTLIEENTDLASRFLEPNHMLELVSKRYFSDSWFGAHYAYEAAFLSGCQGLHADARSRLRMAEKWLSHFFDLPMSERNGQNVSASDIAEMAFAYLNIHGADACARFLRRWRPGKVAFQAGKILACRLIDHGRFRELNELAIADRAPLGLILAITLELSEVQKPPPRKAILRALHLVESRHVKLREPHPNGLEGTLLCTLNALVAAAIQHTPADNSRLAAILRRYLPSEPPRGLTNPYGKRRLSHLRSYMLLAYLEDRTIDIIDLAHPDLHEELENSSSHTGSREAEEFKEEIGQLLPWHKLWVEVVCKNIPKNTLDTKLAKARKASRKAKRLYHREQSQTADEIAQCWFEILTYAGSATEPHLKKLERWCDSLFIPTLTWLARSAAHNTAAGNFVFRCIQKAETLTQSERSEVENAIEVYAKFSRALLAFSKEDSQAYFYKALEIANKIGHENLARWDAFLDLADKAGNPEKPNPEIAYRLARSAEFITEHNVRDKHFPWEATVEAIAALCPTSSLAILSRWSDRHFGWTPELLKAAIKYLVGRKLLDPKAALALIGFQAKWDHAELLSAALEKCQSREEKQAVSDLFYRYMRLDHHAGNNWEAVRDTAKSHGIDLLYIDEVIDFAKKHDQLSRESISNHPSARRSQAKNNAPHWKRIFDGLDITQANDIAVAQKRLESTEPPYEYEHFFEQLCKRIPMGQEAAFIKALPDVPNFGLFDLRHLLNHFPNAQINRPAVKSAFATTFKAFIRRHCLKISTNNRYLQALPLEQASDLSGVNKPELVEVALEAIGANADIVDSRQMFNIVGLVTVMLTQDDALRALTYGLNLMDEAMDETDGDGAWTPELMPPQEINDALAGYIWAALGSPEASWRWQAAHVVRGICTLECGEILSALIRHAETESGGAFADKGLHFYSLHARQWLLIALARAAQESPKTVAQCVDFLVAEALDENSHVIIKGFAAQAALALFKAGDVNLSDSTADSLKNVNKSPFPIVNSSSRERSRPRANKKSKRDRDLKCWFDMDITDYWFGPLGEYFDLTSEEIAQQADNVISEDWGISVNGRWDDDERARRGYFYNLGHMHRHGSLPKVDRLSTYLSYHAMMVVAGKLLSARSLHEDPDSFSGSFADWMQRYALTRPDGKWLADRRDPAPLEWVDWPEVEQDEGWKWSVTREDFDQYLGLNKDRLILFGQWAEHRGQRKERINISSALVAPGRSQALLRALQTCHDPFLYRLPTAGESSEIVAGKFELIGWIYDRELEKGLDRFDPWAGDIEYPPLLPAKFVCDLLALDSDAEQREWSGAAFDDGHIPFSCRIWGGTRDSDTNRRGDNGRRMEVSREGVAALLKKTGKNLIVEVQIKRTKTHSAYHSRKSGELPYASPYNKLYIFKSDGSVTTF